MLKSSIKLGPLQNKKLSGCKDRKTKDPAIIMTMNHREPWELVVYPS